MEFVINQYRHCKTILALGASRQLLKNAGIALAKDGRGRDGGLLVVDAGAKKTAHTFMSALAKHRHPERETEPPVV